MKLLFFFIATCFFKTSFTALTDIKEYSDKILNIYKDPSSSKTSKLLMYAYFYLDQMFKLEEGIEEGKEEYKQFLEKFHSEGGPHHINNIPWAKFIEELKWKGEDISEYEHVIDKTKKSWEDLQKALQEMSVNN